MGLLIIALQVLLVGLKMAAVIAWPWWMVMLPMILWGTMLLVAFAFIGMTIGGLSWVALKLR